ncbi:alanine racemase [Rhizomicrobium palustre]|uniref:Alanine racemase n=1 Tax=Rhizomicrobium palustre TaxID=189966 RepID=A0A846MUP8_9PROT|nr:alanine racemase [Rhizomicrobium palustre]NIK87083.1 alanine racemase [Rhizomicrobium palustre]
MDRVDDGIVSDFEAARLSVRLSAVAENFRTAQRLASPAVVAGVVKADAYGIGLTPVVKTLARAGCDTFFVARLSEGVALRKLVPEAQIFVLDGAQPDMVPALICHRLTPVLNSLAEIAAWSAAAAATHQTLDAAVHLDTGMNRLGLSAGELSILAGEHARRLSGLRVVLWMSHLACADEPEHKMNRLQLDRFKTALAMLPEGPASLSASGGILLGKDYHFDMVRPGLCLYGANPQGGPASPFQPVVSLSATIMQVRQAEKGETVGYSASHRLTRNSILGTAALGYADGILRALSNVGFVAVQGKRVPILGRISMDLLTFDLTDVEGPVHAGDQVELIGPTQSLDDVASAAHTIPYEILTSLSRRARRTYEEDAS